MSYVVIYQVDEDIRTVYVMGIFHELVIGFRRN